MQKIELTAPIRKWSVGRGYHVTVILIPAWVRKKLNLEPGEVVKIIIHKVSLEEEPLNVKTPKQK